MLCHLEAKPKMRGSIPGGSARRGGQATDVACQGGLPSLPGGAYSFCHFLTHVQRWSVPGATPAGV